MGHKKYMNTYNAGGKSNKNSIHGFLYEKSL